MRRALHAHYLRVFRPGMRIVDLGCGTGTDAVMLARYGIHVVGIDAAPGMLELLRQKVTAVGLAPLVEMYRLDIAEIGSLRELGSFDGAISAFAALSSVPDLGRLAGDLAQLIAPRGRVIMHLLNRWSLWEWLGLLGRGQLSAAAALGGQRKRVFVIGGQPVEHQLYRPGEAYAEAFAESFRLRSTYSLGSLRPPHTVRRIPAHVVAMLEWFDLRLGRLALLQNAGRFFVLDLERR